jgi:alanine racemase
MTQATLTIDTDAIVANWRALDAKSADHVETGAVVKADAYGLGAAQVALALSKKGVRSFFVALAEEGIAVRKAVGNGPEIFVFSGMMLTDASVLREYNLIPLLNAPEQFIRFRTELPDAPFGVQLDSGMNRLGMEPDEFAPLRQEATDARLVISHLACADEPDHAQNEMQLNTFRSLTEDLDVRRSLAATGGILLGKDYHFDLCRPGIGLYGGAPFERAKPVVRVSVPVIQSRQVKAGETVGYGGTWVAERNARVATIAAGYADGLIRAMGNGSVSVFAGDTPCPLIGRVSMDLITVDVSALDIVPETLDILNEFQTVDDIADQAGTIGYEILTSLGARYARNYLGE